MSVTSCCELTFYAVPCTCLLLSIDRACLLGMEKKVDSTSIVMPGDVVGVLKPGVVTQVKLGPGLRQDHEEIVATKTGKLIDKGHNKFFVDSHTKRVCAG